jgi:hypothetical protein
VRVSGGYAVTYRDHETGQSKTCQAETLGSIATAVEKALVSPEVPWKAFSSYVNKEGLKRHEKKA